MILSDVQVNKISQKLLNSKLNSPRELSQRIVKNSVINIKGVHYTWIVFFVVGLAYGFVAVISLIRPVSFDNCSITNFSGVYKCRRINTSPPFHSAMHNSHHHYSRGTQWIIINAKNKYSSGMKFWYSRWLLTALNLSLSLQ